MKVDLGIELALLAGLLIVISLVQPLANRLLLSSAVLLAIVGVAKEGGTDKIAEFRFG